MSRAEDIAAEQQAAAQNRQRQRHDVKWIDRGYSATQKPDPRYPDGMQLDTSAGAPVACTVDLPYPAPRCGYYGVRCKLCGTTALVTTAGRPDDPKAVTLACKIDAATTRH